MGEGFKTDRLQGCIKTEAEEKLPQAIIDYAEFKDEELPAVVRNSKLVALIIEERKNK